MNIMYKFKMKFKEGKYTYTEHVQEMQEQVQIHHIQQHTIHMP